MALLTKKEFAAACGRKTKWLSNYIIREKVVANESGLIDDANVVNAEFLKTHADKKQTGGVKRGAGKSSARKEQPAADPEADKAKQAQSTELYELTKRQKTMQIAREERETQILQARIQKMQGELIPTALVKLLFKQHFQAVTMSFKQSLDILLLEIGQSTKANANQIAIWRTKMVALLNEGVNKSVEASKKSVAGVVTEYQELKKSA